MNGVTRADVNPLARIARTAPAALGAPLALGARLAGVAATAALAVDQSYDRTRAVAAAIAALALVSCLPLSDIWRARLQWLGAGILFFGGALLAGSDFGVLALLCGVLAAAAAMIDELRAGRPAGVAAFFAAFGLVGLVTAVTVLAIEG